MWRRTATATPLFAPEDLIRDLYTRTYLNAPRSTSLVLGVTSALDHEGKTTAALNLAATVANDQCVAEPLVGIPPADSVTGSAPHGGDRGVVVVDCHQSRLSASKCLGVDAGPSMVDYLRQACALDDVIQATGRPHLSVVRAGDDRSSLSILIRTEAMRGMIEALRERFRLCILDLPSALTTSDTQVLASLVDRLLLVVRAGVTPGRAIAEALNRLDGARFAGVVLNDHRQTLPGWLDSRL